MTSETTDSTNSQVSRGPAPPALPAEIRHKTWAQHTGYIFPAAVVAIIIAPSSPAIKLLYFFAALLLIGSVKKRLPHSARRVFLDRSKVRAEFTDGRVVNGRLEDYLLRIARVMDAPNAYEVSLAHREGISRRFPLILIEPRIEGAGAMRSYVERFQGQLERPLQILFGSPQVTDEFVAAGP